MTSSTLPTALYSAEQVRELDRLAIQDHGIPGFTLMRRAGRAVARVQRQRWPDCQRLVILCGSGNNAGDGYVVAGIALNRGQCVHLVQLGDPARLQGDAARARDWAKKRGLHIRQALPDNLGRKGDLLVDALLGTGLKGSVRSDYSALISQAAASDVPVLAVDLPSGLSADSGAILGCVLPAQATVSFIGLKRGLFTGSGPAVCGRVYFDDLAVPATVLNALVPTAQRIVPSGFAPALAPRPRDAHKGRFGHVLVVGGELGFGGASIMAAEAAARSGAGLVSLATRGEHVPAALSRRPELMAHAVASGQDLPALLERAGVLVLGPGLSDSAWSQQLFREACQSGLPMVVDAGALHLLKSQINSIPWPPEAAVLTPHPGEAAALLDCTVAEVQADRFVALAELQKRYRSAVVLKGSGTLVSGEAGQVPALCDLGNPGMASGGMGDVLAGIIGGLLAQGLSAGQAATAGAWLHARAADLAAVERGERGLLATDLLRCLPPLLNQQCK